MTPPTRTDDEAAVTPPPSGPKHAKPRKGKRAIVVVVVVVAALAVSIAAALGARAWLADRELHNQAAVATGGTTVCEANPNLPTFAGATSGNAAAGGIAIIDGSTLFEASSEGVFRRDLGAEADSAAQELASESAFDLCLVGDQLVYLVSASRTSQAFEGASVQSVPVEPESTSDAQTQKLEYEPSREDARLSCLVAGGKSLLFLEQSDGAYSIMQLTGREIAPINTAHIEADSAWIFAERDELFLVTSTDGSWTVAARGFDERAQFIERAHGTGDIATAALHDGTLYYALKSDTDDVRLQRNDLKGNVAEFPDVVNPVRIASYGDIVAVVTKSGQLIWVDSVTGVVHDLTDRIESRMSAFVPTTVALSVCGEWICVANDKGEFCRINANSAEVFGTV